MSAIRVFDLSAAVGGIRAGAYFADSNGRIFSKISNTGRRVALLAVNKNGGTTSFYEAEIINGTNTVSGRYFSFAGTNMDSARTSYHKGILDSYIKRYLHENPKIATFLSSVEPVTEELHNCVPRVAVPKAGSFEFYVIARLVNGSPSFSSGPKVHTDMTSARTEALRLAGLYPGAEFMIFKANSSVSTGSTVWKVAP